MKFSIFPGLRDKPPERPGERGLWDLELERQTLIGSQGPFISGRAAFFPILVEENKSLNKGTLSALASREGHPGNGDPSIYAASGGQAEQAAPDPLPAVVGIRDPLLGRAISHLVLA